jgi:hypothetical protein
VTLILLAALLLRLVAAAVALARSAKPDPRR